MKRKRLIRNCALTRSSVLHGHDSWWWHTVPSGGRPEVRCTDARVVFEQDVLSQRASAQASAITGEGARRTPAIEMHVCWIGVIPTILCRTAALLEPPFEMLARAPKRRMVQTVNATLQGSGWYETGTYVWTVFCDGLSNCGGCGLALIAAPTLLRG